MDHRTPNSAASATCPSASRPARLLCRSAVGAGAALLLALAAALALPSRAPAQEGPAGHWEGAIELPGNQLSVVVDLARGEDGWRGEVDIPAQGARDLALDAVRVAGDSVTFSMSGVPGQPTFRGTVAAGDTARIEGDFTQSGRTFPFSLTRAGPPDLSGPAADEAGEPAAAAGPD